MARIPISFYLNILAGILVLFHHFASSETGDVALNKITGAAGRFYTLFQDAAIAFQHGCTSRLHIALCGPFVDDILPRDAAEYIRVRYCYVSAPESADGTSGHRQHHGGYGSSDFAFVYYRSPMRPLSRTSAESPFSLDWPSQRRLSQIVWDRSSEAMAMIGILLLRTCVSWWWFRAPVKVTGVFLSAYAALLAFGYFLGANVVLRYISQVYLTIVADFLQCIEWEAQRQVLDMGVVMMERAYCAAQHAPKR